MLAESFKIVTLDNREIQVNIKHIVSPTSVIKLDNEGLYTEKNLETKGNLYIKFNIEFPEFIT